MNRPELLVSVLNVMSVLSSSPRALSSVAVPTSFEGPFGKIVYRVRAVIDTPRFSKDYKAQRPFYLLNLLNLNEVPDIEVSLMHKPSHSLLFFHPLQTNSYLAVVPFEKSRNASFYLIKLYLV